MFASLYIFAYNVGAALFALIERWLPDVLSPDYSQGGVEALRWSAAGIVTAFPVFALVSRLVRRTIDREPEKRLSGVRRWLTYLTLFLAALVLIGNFIVLVSGFFSGDLTARFLLKSLVVFAIAGLAFVHYLGGLRREEADAAAHRGRAWTSHIAVAGAAVVLVAAMIVMGSPMTARKQKMDERRINDLEQISNAVERYALAHGHLPASLDVLSDETTALDSTDPVTGAPYEYMRVDSTSYRLCASFTLAGGRTARWRTPAGETWKHPAGRYCYTLHWNRPRR
jgi:type II secretory pathway pseudopilin PulG